MPRTFWSATERSYTARFASRTWSASVPSPSRNIASTVSSARLDATSPPRCPPMPSATAYSGASTRKESSLHLADPADVGGGPDLDPHRRSSSTVVPTRTRSPGCTMAGAASRWSFTNVPFVEPRSSTYQEPFFAKSRACCWEMKVSSSGSSHSSARPDHHVAAHRHGARLRALGVDHDRRRAGRHRRLGGGPALLRRAARRPGRGLDAQPAHRPSHRAPDEQQQQREQPVLQGATARTA